MSAEPRIHAQMSIPEIIRDYPQTRGVFLHYGLPVEDYKAAAHEDLSASSRVHQIDLTRILADLNRVAGA